MFSTKMFVTCVVIPFYLLPLLLSTCQCLPQIQGDSRGNNNFLTQDGSQNNNRDQINANNAINGGQRNLVGGFQPSNFGNNLIRFPDGTSRAVGGRQPQRSPFRNPSQNVAAATQGNRRPDPQFRPLPQPPIPSANTQGRERDPTSVPSQPSRPPFRNPPQNVADTTAGNRRPDSQLRPLPQPPRPSANTQGRPHEPAIVPPQTARPQRPAQPRLILPAIPVTSKFVRPDFDVLGMPLIFGEILPQQDDILPDFVRRRPTNSNGNENRRPKTTADNNPRNELSNQRRPPISNLSPDLRLNLPPFGTPDLLLKATEELRSSDVNQESILPWGTVNAGILPLATESTEDQRLGFFPPFAKTQPK